MNVIYNTVWMIVEKLILSISLLLINAYVARYLGPSQYGIIAYITTILSISVVASNFGTNTLLFQRISKRASSARAIIPSIQLIRCVLYAICSLLIYSYLKLSGFLFNNYLFLGLCLAFYFQAIDSYSWYFDAKLKSKYNSIINTIALGVALILRFFLVKYALELQWFFLPYAANYALSFLLRKYFFKKKVATISILNLLLNKLSRNKKVICYFLCAGFPLFLSEISILLYTRLTNLYLGQIDGIDAVGIFNASYVLASAWTIMPIAFITSVFTIIYKEQNSDVKISLGSGLVFINAIVGVILTIFCYSFSDFIIHLIYGSRFTSSSNVFPLLFGSTIFSLIGIVSYRTIIAFNGYAFIAKKMVVMGLISIPLNYFLINLYGVKGAAYATIIIEFISATIANYFFQNGIISKMHWMALSRPIHSVMFGLSKVLNKL